MVAVEIILLITLAVILTIGTITAVSVAAVAASNNNSGASGTTGLPACSQNINIDTLIKIPDVGANCIQQGVPTNLYYIGKLGDQTYDFVVATYGNSPLNVCSGYCQGGVINGQCTGPSYAGKSAQENFNICMSQLTSTTCEPPIPLAAKGTDIYYALSPTCRACDNCANK